MYGFLNHVKRIHGWSGHSCGSRRLKNDRLWSECHINKTSLAHQISIWQMSSRESGDENQYLLTRKISPLLLAQCSRNCTKALHKVAKKNIHRYTQRQCADRHLCLKEKTPRSHSERSNCSLQNGLQGIKLLFVRERVCAHACVWACVSVCNYVIAA